MASGSSARSIQWLAESLRCTAFTNRIEGRGAWERVTGEAPEALQENPRQGTLVESGTFENGSLSYGVGPNRVDWIFAPLRENVTDFNSLAGSGAALERFSRLIAKWLREAHDLQRLACGMTLVAPTTDRKEGYQALRPYLPAVNIDPIGSSDLIYQINRPRESRVLPGVRVNRISAWQVSVQQQLAVSLHGALSASPQSFTCQVTLDLSTDAARAEPLPGDSTKIWEELGTMGLEIASEGEVP